MQKSRKNRKGFTLVELMVVVVIIGILTAIAIPVYMSVTANAEKTACQANQRTIDSAIVVYMASGDTTTYPTDVDALVTANFLAVAPTAKCGCTYQINQTTGLCTVTYGTGITDHALHGVTG